MKKVWYVLSMALILLIASCQSDNPSMITLGLDDTYVVERMKGLTLHPGFTGGTIRMGSFLRVRFGIVTDSIVATTRDYTFVASETGTYRLRFQIYDAANPITHLMRIVVRKEEVAYSPYITKVYEYRPAPGQFVNELPKYTEGDTEESMRQKVEDCLAYDAVRWSRWEATADILSSVSTIRLSIGRENTISKYWVMHFMPMTILVPMPRWEVVANPG